MSILSVTDRDTVHALAHPLRLRILDALRQPASAAQVAREIGHPRQKVNYHLKGLERAGLVRAVGERRTGNFIESLYQAVARSFVVSPRVAWADARRAKAMAEQVSLGQLVVLGEIIQQDAAALLDRATFDGEQVASASVAAEVKFRTERDRAEFLEAYLAAIGPLVKKYGGDAGETYRVVLAVYPQPSTEGQS